MEPVTSAPRVGDDLNDSSGYSTVTKGGRASRLATAGVILGGRVVSSSRVKSGGDGITFPQHGAVMQLVTSHPAGRMGRSI